MTAAPPARRLNLLGTTLSIIVCRGVSVLAASAVAILSARQLGPSGRGALVLMLTLAPFTAVVTGMGVNVAGRVHMVAADDPVPIGEYFGLTGALAALNGLVCAGVGAVLLPLAGVGLSAGGLVLFGAVGATLLLQFAVTDALNTFGHTVAAAAIESAGFLLQVVLAVALVLHGTRRFQPFVAAVMVAGWLHITVTLVLLRRRVGPIEPRYDRRNWGRLVRTGWPAIPSTLSQLLTFRVDRYIVGVFLNPAAVGVYSVAATVPEFLRIIPLALGQSIFYRVASRQSRPTDFRRALTVCVAATAGLGVAISLLAPLGVRVLFGPAFSGAVTPLRILLLAEVAMAVFNVDGAVLSGMGRFKEGAAASLVGVGVVLAFDFVLIAADGITGAAWASVIAYSVMAVIVHRMVVRGPRSRRPARAGDAQEPSQAATR